MHIDHVGRIPYLLAAGFKGPILCSEPSAKLLPIVLEDAFELGFSRDQAKVGRYLKLIEQRIVALPYKTWFNLVDSAQLMARIRLQRAGHILGSAYVEVDLHYPLTGKRKRVVFSGDLGAPHAPILPAPKAPQRADILVIESTYGDRLHEDRRKRLEQILEQALADRGTVLIPAFSIGRTQELLYELEEILHRRASSKRAPVNGIDWHNLPIILDSPLAGRFTLVYRELEPFWDAEALARVRSGRKPLAFGNLLTVDSRQAHLAMVKRLVQTAQPAIVIAGNGMCSSGRIVSYLKTMHRRCHAQRFVRRLPGRGTTGRQIQRFGSRGRFVIMDGQPYDIRGQIHTIGGYSAHADQNGLLGFVTRMRHWPSEIRIVHGDPAVKQVLADALRRGYSQRSRAVEVVIP
ncbi:MBL fold metallo-hydrolase RNA specificity domain-containing protein [Ectopseudomonas hydrolytica]|uniref:MBL fold metallo-hydrolase RNA specificity domain-containing protein n=1 Tax=Ectopseudomonas hydrolytica TaxID=2493633 RepID=UPI003C2D6C94